MKHAGGMIDWDGAPLDADGSPDPVLTPDADAEGASATR